MRVIRHRETIDPSRESIGNYTGFFTAHGSPSTSSFAEFTLPVLYDSLGHQWWQFWHLYGQRWILCLGAPLENPFKTNWREVLSCSPIQLFQHRTWSERVDNGCVLERKFGTSASPDYTWKRRRKWDQLSVSVSAKILWWSWCSFWTKWTSRTSWTSWTARSTWPTTRMASSSIACWW